jgi:glutamate-1-semialdehyde 2,1-aminomutase
MTTVPPPAAGARQADLARRSGRVLPGASLGSFYFPEGRDRVFVRGAGPRLWDADGNEYVDWLLGAGSLLLGHAHPNVVAAVQAQLARGTTYYALNEPAITLAETMVEAIPCAEQVKFAADGTGATFFALRLARAYTHREVIVRFEGSYHGYHDYSTLGSMYSKVPDPLPEFPLATFDSAGVPSCLGPTVLSIPYNDLQVAERVLLDRRDEIAAVIVEPVQRAIPPEPGFLAGLRDLTQRIGALLVFDEVVTGFRLAYGGAQERYGVTADLACYGKALAGGMPIGAVVGPHDVLRLANPRRGADPDFAFCTGTFSGNPLSAAAANATLAELQRPGTYEHLRTTAASVRATLEHGLAAAAVDGQVVGEGPILSVAFSEKPIRNFRDSLAVDSTMAAAFHLALLEGGTILHPRKLYVSTQHTPGEIEELGDAIEGALAVALRARADQRA